MIRPRKEKIIVCSDCGFIFTDQDDTKTCSNCFACTGCEIYICPSCGTEVVVKAIKPMSRENSVDNSQF